MSTWTQGNESSHLGSWKQEVSGDLEIGVQAEQDRQKPGLVDLGTKGSGRGMEKGDIWTVAGEIIKIFNNWHSSNCSNPKQSDRYLIWH